MEKVENRNCRIPGKLFGSFLRQTCFCQDGQSWTLKTLKIVLKKIGLVAKTNNPSFIAKSNDGKTLVAVDETDVEGTGFVKSYRIDKDSLAYLSTSKSGGAHPCFLNINENDDGEKIGRIFFLFLTSIPLLIVLGHRLQSEMEVGERLEVGTLTSILLLLCKFSLLFSSPPSSPPTLLFRILLLLKFLIRDRWQCKTQYLLLNILDHIRLPFCRPFHLPLNLLRDLIS